MTTFNENLNFHYPKQMQYLYENSMRINHDLLREILALPQNELLDDLETVLKDAQNRYKENRRNLRQFGNRRVFAVFKFPFSRIDAARRNQLRQVVGLGVKLFENT